MAMQALGTIVGPLGIPVRAIAPNGGLTQRPLDHDAGLQMAAILSIKCLARVGPEAAPEEVARLRIPFYEDILTVLQAKLHLWAKFEARLRQRGATGKLPALPPLLNRG
jgi:hypothetical protein